MVLVQGEYLAVICSMYLVIAMEGIIELPFNNVKGQSWGQPHRRAIDQQRPACVTLY